MNFCIEEIGTTITCDQVQSDGNEAEKLLQPYKETQSLGFGSQARGFLTDYFVRPPVTLNVRLPVCIEISHVVIVRKFGVQASSAFSISSETSYKPFSKIDGDAGTSTSLASGPKHLVAKEYLDKNAPAKIVFRNRRYQPRPPFSLLTSQNTEGLVDELTFDLRHPTSFACHRAVGLQITILQTTGMSVAGLGGLEIWGQPCQRCPKEVAYKLLAQWMRRNRKTKTETSSSNPSTSSTEETENTAKRRKTCQSTDTLVIPEEFLDPITHEIMCLPIRLPCGVAVDSTTLEKYYKEEATWARPANDPFTGQPYTDNVKPIADGALKSRIDHFMTTHAGDQTIRNAPRTLGSQPKPVTPQIRIVASKLFPTHTSEKTPILHVNTSNDSSTSQQSSSTNLSKEALLQEELAKVLGAGSSYFVKPSEPSTSHRGCTKCGEAMDSKIIFYSLPNCIHVKLCRSCVLAIAKTDAYRCQTCSIEWTSQDLQRAHIS